MQLVDIVKELYERIAIMEKKQVSFEMPLTHHTKIAILKLWIVYHMHKISEKSKEIVELC